MDKFILKHVVPESVFEELHHIGFDEGYCFVAKDKFEYKNIKVFNLTVAQANILKQTALSVGADCATNRDVVTGKAGLSDVILCGSFSQLKKIAEKLKFQPFRLGVLGEQIIDFVKERNVDTKLAGILNVTPDSFSDGGLYYESKDAVNHLMELIEDGADIIDIGAESTRPNSESVSSQEQITRLKPVLNFIQKENLKIPISVDTKSSEVADFVLNNGVSLINDVSGFDYDSNMPKIVSGYKAGVIIQHSRGNSQTMQDDQNYNNLIDDIFLSLKSKKDLAEENGVKNIIIDPGIGFGKTKEQNFEILNRIEEFYALNCPVMVGVSRKSLLGVREDNNELKDALSLAISYPLIKKKIDYLRVHNVKLHKHIVRLG